MIRICHELCRVLLCVSVAIKHNSAHCCDLYCFCDEKEDRSVNSLSSAATISYSIVSVIHPELSRVDTCCRSRPPLRNMKIATNIYFSSLSLGVSSRTWQEAEYSKEKDLCSYFLNLNVPPRLKLNVSTVSKKCNFQYNTLRFLTFNSIKFTFSL